MLKSIRLDKRLGKELELEKCKIILGFSRD